MPDNDLTVLPAAIANLINLRELDVSKNSKQIFLHVLWTVEGCLNASVKTAGFKRPRRAFMCLVRAGIIVDTSIGLLKASPQTGIRISIHLRQYFDPSLSC